MPTNRDALGACVVAMSLAVLGPPATGCGKSNDSHGARRPALPGSDAPTRTTTARIGNPDPRGVESQPDYDREALTLRESLASRLPDPLPELDRACTTMLEAVQTHYAEVEPDSHRRATLVERFRSTSAADLRGCRAETSAAAASCTTILLRERKGEFPWLLDQCSRAFPR